MIKVVVSDRQDGYARWIPNNVIIPKEDIAQADLLLLTGGEDINPEIYGDIPYERLWFNPSRDIEEIRLYKEAIKHKIPIWGTCRGHQLLSALNGCKLFQDVTNHAGQNHSMIARKLGTEKYAEMTTNSLHHQMVNPFVETADPNVILAFSPSRRSSRYVGSEGKTMEVPKNFVEVEGIYFPSTLSVGIQGHPEMSYNETFVNYCIDLLNELFEEKRRRDG